VSLSSLFDSVARAFGVLCNVASSSHLAKLRGEGGHAAIPQLFADLLRVCVAVGALCPLVLLPLVRPLMRGLFDADDAITDAGFAYVLPMIAASAITCLSQLLCGVMQSEGRAGLYGAVQVSSFLLNMFVFDPLFLFALDLGMFGAGLATVCAEACPLAVVLAKFARGEFETRTSLAHLARCCTARVRSALQPGVTQFIAHLCFALPSFFSRTFVSAGAEASGKYTAMLAAFNSVLKCSPFALSFVMAVSRALLPAASFAVGAHDPRRVTALFTWASLIVLAWCAFTELILLTCGRYIAQIFDTDTDFIEASTLMIRNSYALQIVAGQGLVTTPLLSSLAYRWTAIGFSIMTRFAPVPLFGAILFFTDPSRNIFRQMWMYSLNDAFTMVVGLACAFFPLRQLRSEAAAMDEDILQPMRPGAEKEDGREAEGGALPLSEIGETQGITF
jgi:Na+-driven multidrug efflux pump